MSEIKQLKTSVMFEFTFSFCSSSMRTDCEFITDLSRNDGTLSFQESALMRELEEHLFQSSLTKAILFYVQLEFGCKQKFSKSYENFFTIDL